MSRIDDLIEELCPNGVEYRPLSELGAKASNIRWSDAAENVYKYIDLSSVDRVTKQIRQTIEITAADAPSRARQLVRAGDVIFATTRPSQMRWTVIPEEYDNQIASTGYCVLRPESTQVLTGFLAHSLGTETFKQYVIAQQVEGNYPSIPDARVRAFRIPVPPLEVQREIVSILDKFTALEAELEAELEARKKQYEYYRDELLTLESTPRQKLGEIARLVRGNGMPKSVLTETGIGAIHYGQIYTYYGVSTEETVSFVSEETASKLTFAETGDVIITNTSENLEDVGKAVAWLGKAPIVTGGHATVIKHDFEPKFLAYWLQTPDFHQQKKRLATGTKVIDVSAKKLEKIEIPVPPLAEQRRIVEILDKFDALVNDLSTGIPAEIAARRKQYEYYRDRLLTFKELGTE